jgi:hypothetical protein
MVEATARPKGPFFGPWSAPGRFSINAPCVLIEHAKQKRNFTLRNAPSRHTTLKS